MRLPLLREYAHRSFLIQHRVLDRGIVCLLTRKEERDSSTLLRLRSATPVPESLAPSKTASINCVEESATNTSHIEHILRPPPSFSLFLSLSSSSFLRLLSSFNAGARLTLLLPRNTQYSAHHHQLTPHLHPRLLARLSLVLGFTCCTSSVLSPSCCLVCPCRFPWLHLSSSLLLYLLLHLPLILPILLPSFIPRPPRIAHLNPRIQNQSY